MKRRRKRSRGKKGGGEKGRERKKGRKRDFSLGIEPMQNLYGKSNL